MGMGPLRPLPKSLRCVGMEPLGHLDICRFAATAATMTRAPELHSTALTLIRNSCVLYSATLSPLRRGDLKKYALIDYAFSLSRLSLLLFQFASPPACSMNLSWMLCDARGGFIQPEHAYAWLQIQLLRICFFFASVCTCQCFHLTKRLIVGRLVNQYKIVNSSSFVCMWLT